MYIGIGTGQRDSLLCRALFGMDAVTHGRTERHTERQIHKLKTSWLLEYLQKDWRHALTFGGTEGSMLGRRGWFDASSKGMVQCQIKGNGLILGQRG